MTIRLARLVDLPALSQLKRASFTQTFLEDFAIPYPPKDLAAFLEENYSEEALRADLENPRVTTWVVEDDTQGSPQGAEDGRGHASRRLIGYLKVCPCSLPHEDVREGDGEISQLYVLRDHHGKRLGT